MLAEIEQGLVDLVKNSPLGARLRAVDSLPDLEGDSLIGRFSTDAPAVYVALGQFQVNNRRARLKYGIAGVARNSRGHQAARQGDGIQIGLYEILDALITLLDGATVNGVGWAVTACDQVVNDELYKKGVYAGVVQIESTGEVPLPPFINDSLAPFKVFHADYDIDPHESVAEHNKWLKEPSDTSTSKPEVSDTLNLQT